MACCSHELDLLYSGIGWVEQLPIVAPEFQFTNALAIAVINQDGMSFTSVIQEFFAPLPQPDQDIKKAATLIC